MDILVLLWRSFALQINKIVYLLFKFHWLFGVLVVELDVFFYAIVKLQISTDHDTFFFVISIFYNFLGVHVLTLFLSH